MSAPAQGQFLTPRPVHRAWGALTTLNIPEPAPGKPWKLVTPGGYLTRIVSIRVQYLASATVANRTPGVTIAMGSGKVIFEQFANNHFVATEPGSVCLYPGALRPSEDNTLGLTIPVLDLPLEPETVIEGVTAELQAGDQYGDGVALVEQFEPYPDHPIAEILKDSRAIELLQEAARLATE